MQFEKRPSGVLFKAGRTFSFCLMLGFFIAVFYLIFFQPHFLRENLLLFGEAVIALVLVNVVFPRALELVKKNGLSEGMKTGAKMFAERFSHAIGIITLSITYVVGVGLVFLISRLFRKRFMEINQKGKQSYWIEKKEMPRSEEMF